MGNRPKSMDFSENQPFLQRLSKDPSFERYFYSNRPFFSRIPIEIPLEESLNSDCFGCNFLKKPLPVKPLKNWLFYLKSQCEELKSHCKFTVELSQFLHKFPVDNPSVFVEKYIIDLYYIDYKLRIFEENDEFYHDKLNEKSGKSCVNSCEEKKNRKNHEKTVFHLLNR